MINQNKWINSLPKTEQKNSVKKYSLIGILFVCGLLLVSALKNETRNLQKEINNLEASINIIKFNLTQTILDNEVITSPKNISLLAEEYLELDLQPYKRSQIKHLNDKPEKLTEIKKQKVKIFSENAKSKITKKIREKKVEIRKFQKLYSKPEAIPDEIKTQVAKKIKEKKFELKNMYQSPQDTFTLARVGKWSVVQVVKAFFGMPILPGR